MTSPFQPRQIVVVRMRVNSQHVQFQTLSNPSSTGNYPEGFERNSSPLSCLRGLFSRDERLAGRNKFLGAFKAPRSLLLPLVNRFQQATSGLAYGFENLLGLFGFHDRQP